MSQTKLTETQVAYLVHKYTGAIVDMACDSGTTPADYAKAIFSSPEFFAFCTMLGKVPGAYEADAPVLVRELVAPACTDVWGMADRGWDPFNPDHRLRDPKRAATKA